MQSPTVTCSHFGQTNLFHSQGFVASWTTTNADRVTVNGQSNLPGSWQPLPLQGSKVLFPLPLSGTFTFAIEAIQDRQGLPPLTASYTTTVNVVQDSPVPPEPSVPAPFTRAPTRPSLGNQRLLTLADLTLLGAFGLQQPSQGTLNGGRAGISFRVVNGETRFFVIGTNRANSPLMEYALVPPVDPSLAVTSPASFPRAPLREYWGDKWGGIPGEYSVAKNPASDTAIGGSLWLDDGTNTGNGVLWLVSGAGYNTGPVLNQPLFQVRFNGANTYPPGAWGSLKDASGNNVLPTGCGAWGGYNPAYPKEFQLNKTAGGLWLVPEAYLGYFGNMPLAVCGGSMYSIATTDSYGPCAFLLNWPSGPPATFAFKSILDHPPAAQGMSSVDHPEMRPGDYTSFPGQFWANPDPKTGLGSWTGVDLVTSIPIVTNNVQGLLCLGTRGVGQVDYVSSDLYSDYVEPMGLVYDFADLAATFRGECNPWDNQPCEMSDAQSMFPVRPRYPTSGHGGPKCLVVNGGIQVGNLVYVLTSQAWKTPDETEWEPMMYVYEVP